MATFPRGTLPQVATWPFLPGALKSMSHTGLLQIRNTKQVGWTWVEEFGLLSARRPTDMDVMAFMTMLWNRGGIHDFTHPQLPGSGLAPNGLGTGGILVDGGAQVGDTLLTDAWPAATANCVRSGDVIKIAGDNAVYMVNADADSNGSGEVDIPITPPLRLSPGNDVAVTTTGVTFRATILSRGTFEQSRSPQYWAGLNFVVGEALI